MEGIIGEIRMFAGGYAPKNWALCDGQLLAVRENEPLYLIIGRMYGGDGITNFGLPDLRSRTPIGAGTGPGLSTYKEGDKGGVETVTLNINQIPAHTHHTKTHAASPIGRGQATTDPSKAYWGNGGSYGTQKNNVMAEDAVYIDNTGGSQFHENRHPFLSINYIICLYGIFPSRN